MKYLKKYEGFTNTKLTDIKTGSIILYQGSKCEVIEANEFTIKVRSLQTDKEFLINQGQADDIRLSEGKLFEETIKKEKGKRIPTKLNKRKKVSKKTPIRLPDWDTY